MMQIKPINFEDIRDYWIKQNHFNNVVNKVIKREVKYLGPYTIGVKHPYIQEYGLYDDLKMIGVTQIHQWDEQSIRYRTMNIIPEYRGNNLFLDFLTALVKHKYTEYERLVGWYREAAFPWTVRNNFKPIDGNWHLENNTRYIMVEKPISELIDEMTENAKNIRFKI